MKALSVRQPYAFAITIGAKNIENRDWRDTNPGRRFRGKVLIHSSKTEEKNAEEDVLWSIVHQLGLSYPDVLERYTGSWLGAIVGAATIVDVVDHHPSPWFFGKIGLVLTNPVACKPVTCKGMLGFFSVPDEVTSRLHIPGYIENGKEVA